MARGIPTSTDILARGRNWQPCNQRVLLTSCVLATKLQAQRQVFFRKSTIQARFNHSHSYFQPPSVSIKNQVPVELAYDAVEPSNPSPEAKDQSLVICHGLFGSKQNWRSLAKAFASKLGMPIYTLDLRNHGQSPHASPHTYTAMAADIHHFLESHKLTSGVNLLGHSMGGKAVMALALNKDLNEALRSLICIDMSPAKGKMSPEFAAYTEAMMEIERAQVKTKHEADLILQKTEPVLAIRQFLLTNTRHSHRGDSHLVFRIPLSLIADAISQIGDFPYSPPPPISPNSPQWEGPALFLKGEHSRYLNKHTIPVAEKYFPNMKLEVLDAGHWVHAEKPQETVDLIQAFVKGVSD
nr:mitochondrial protein [Cryptococcus depauperatus CBS 7841]